MKTRFAFLVFFFFFFTIIHSAQAQTDYIRQFIFGHSLIDHRPPAIPTPSDETTVPHWLYLLAEAADKEYSASGQYGFLPQHANLPPFSQWGYDIVPPAWESDTETFTEANFTQTMITAGNFMQWQGPDMVYPGGDGVTTPISATITIIDWLREHEPDMVVYIYENWPDMAPYLNGVFPPTEEAFANYNSYTTGEFHDWWIEYQDALLAERPEVYARMIPVGPTLVGLLTETPLSDIPLSDLYEDDAPHGRPTLYFLASLITYSAIFAEPAPANFTDFSTLHPLVSSHYQSTVDYIWTELENFNDEDGTSRVFFEEPNDLSELDKEVLRLYPNPATDQLVIESPWVGGQLELLDLSGRVLHRQMITNSHQVLSLSQCPQGMYALRLIHPETGQILVSRVGKR